MDPEDKFLHSLRKSEQSKHQEPSNEAWERIQHVLETKKKKRKVRPIMYWQQIAATFLLIIFLSVIYYFFIKSPVKSPIAKSQEKQIDMPLIVQDTMETNIALNEEKTTQQKGKLTPPGNTNGNKGHSPKEQNEDALAFEQQIEKSKPSSAMDQSGGTENAKRSAARTESPAMTSVPQTSLQLAYSLFPSDAGGRWAGSYNGTSYTAVLKGSGSDWELAGSYISGTRKKEEFIIGEQTLKYQTQKITKNYTYEGLDVTQSKYSNPKDPKDYFMISYEKDKISIYQYGRSSSKPINSWILIKSYE